MTGHINVGGAWKDLTDIQVNVGGAWKRCDFGYVYQGGAWKEFFAYDVTGPSAVTNFDARWNNTYGEQAYVTWNQPSSSDLAYTDLYVNRGSGYVYLTRFTQGPGVACSYSDYNLTWSASTWAGYTQEATPVHTYLLRPYDVRGNQGTDATRQTRGANDTVVRGMLRSPFYLNPSGSATWSGDGYWRTDNDQVLQGLNNFGRHYGHWFYENTVAWRFNISSSNILAQRVANAGFAQGRPLGLRLSNAGSLFPFTGTDPTGQLVTGRVDSGDFAWNDAEWTYVPPDWAADLVSSTGTNRNSIVIDSEETSVTGYGFSNNYARFEGASYDVAFGLKSGAIQIYHSG